MVGKARGGEAVDDHAASLEVPPDGGGLEAGRGRADRSTIGASVMAWLDDRRLSADERKECLDALAIRSDGQWWNRFFVVMLVAVIIATVGQLLDSAAVVIGAMLIAPLMTPVLALSASLAMGWPRQAVRQFAGLVGATAGAVAVAWLIGTVAPEDPLTNEVLSRTSPDLRDLVVALAAGFGGAYVTVRRNMSGSLPGVAVAVALVPPLGAVGLSLSAGQRGLAWGAGLLYAANLGAIVLSGLAVFVATGFVPARRLTFSWARVVAGATVALAVVGLVAVPLARASAEAVANAQRAEQVNRRVTSWLSESPNRLSDVTVDGTEITVAVVGPVQPPSVTELRQGLEEVVGSDLNLQVRWIQESTPLGDGEPEGGGDVATLAEASEPPPLELVEPAVEDWLSQSEAPAGSFEVVGIEISDDGLVAVDIRAATAPPSSDALATLIEDRLGRSVRITVEWTDTSAEEVTPLDEVTSEIRALARRWAESQPGGLAVDAVEVVDGVAYVDLVGRTPPEDAATLAESIRSQVDLPIELEVRFSTRLPIPTETTTTATTPTTTIPAGPSTTGAEATTPATATTPTS